MSQEDSFIRPDWVGSLWKYLRKKMRARDVELERISRVFEDPVELARYYVEPNCQPTNPANRHEDTDPATIFAKPVFRAIGEFLEGDFAQPRMGKNQLFVLSDAGMGKTSLLLMLKLQHLGRFWPSKFDCRLLKLGPDTLAEIEGMENTRRTILLLDALDEDPLAWGRVGNRLLDILQATRVFHRTILSCRTQFFPTVSVGSEEKDAGVVRVREFNCPVFFLSFFDRKQVDSYLCNRFPSGPLGFRRSNTSLRRRAIAITEKMDSLRCRPLLLSHIEDLVSSDLREWTEYDVYNRMVDAWLDRECIKLYAQGKRDVTRELLRSASVSVAGMMSVSGSRLLSKESIDEALLNTSGVEPLLDIDFQGRSLLNRNSEGALRFAHFSIQEFLYAEFLLNEGESSQAVVLPSNATEKLIDFVFHGRSRFGTRRGVIAKEISMVKHGFQQLSMDGCLFERCDFRESRWTDVSLSGAKFVSCDFTGSALRDVSFAGALIAECRFPYIRENGIDVPNPIQGLSYNLRLGGQSEIEFAWIPEGGLELTDSGLGSVVRMRQGFWMSRYAVTERLFNEVTGSARGRDMVPVVNVSWDAAGGFCRELEKRLKSEDGLQLNDSGGRGLSVRLPTELEWEYACRAGSSAAYCFGDDSGDLKNYAWYRDNVTKRRAQPVGGKQPNEWGLYDMHGNVWEWCADEVSGERRVLRGGSWYLDAEYCRSASRISAHPDGQDSLVGFRVVLAPPL